MDSSYINHFYDPEKDPSYTDSFLSSEALRNSNVPNTTKYYRFEEHYFITCWRDDDGMHVGLFPVFEGINLQGSSYYVRYDVPYAWNTKNTNNQKYALLTQVSHESRKYQDRGKEGWIVQCGDENAYDLNILFQEKKQNGFTLTFCNFFNEHYKQVTFRYYIDRSFEIEIIKQPQPQLIRQDGFYFLKYYDWEHVYIFDTCYNNRFYLHDATELHEVVWNDEGNYMCSVQHENGENEDIRGFMVYHTDYKVLSNFIAKKQEIYLPTVVNNDYKLVKFYFENGSLKGTIIGNIENNQIGGSSAMKPSIDELVKHVKFVKAVKKPLRYKQVFSHDDVNVTKRSYYVHAQDKRLKVTTVVKGEKEVVNVCKRGDVIITGTMGEQYVVSASKFFNLYDVVGGVAIPRQEKRTVAHVSSSAWNKVVPKDVKEITFKTSWGQQMALRKGDYIVKDKKHYYRIAKKAFKDTYGLK